MLRELLDNLMIMAPNICPFRSHPARYDGQELWFLVGSRGLLKVAQFPPTNWSLKTHLGPHLGSKSSREKKRDLPGDAGTRSVKVVVVVAVVAVVVVVVAVYGDITFARSHDDVIVIELK